MYNASQYGKSKANFDSAYDMRDTGVTLVTNQLLYLLFIVYLRAVLNCLIIIKGCEIEKYIVSK